MSTKKKRTVVHSALNVSDDITNTMFIAGAPKTAIANRAKQLAGEESAQRALKSMSQATKTKRETTKKSVLKSLRLAQKHKLENSRVHTIDKIGKRTKNSNLNIDVTMTDTFWLEDAPRRTNERIAKKLAGNENMAKALKSINGARKKKA